MNRGKRHFFTMCVLALLVYILLFLLSLILSVSVYYCAIEPAALETGNKELSLPARMIDSKVKTSVIDKIHGKSIEQSMLKIIIRKKYFYQRKFPGEKMECLVL